MIQITDALQIINFVADDVDLQNAKKLRTAAILLLSANAELAEYVLSKNFDSFTPKDWK